MPTTPVPPMQPRDANPTPRARRHKRPGTHEQPTRAHAFVPIWRAAMRRSLLGSHVHDEAVTHVDALARLEGRAQPPGSRSPRAVGQAQPRTLRSHETPWARPGRRRHKASAVGRAGSSPEARSRRRRSGQTRRRSTWPQRHLFVCPVLVGEGKAAFPSDARIQLDLLEERRFGNGVVNLHYRIQS